MLTYRVKDSSTSLLYPIKTVQECGVLMKFTVSWWDEKDGVGVAISEGGLECLLHRSNISPNQTKQLKPRMIIHGESKQLSRGVVIIEKLRTTKNFESVASFKRMVNEAAA